MTGNGGAPAGPVLALRDVEMVYRVRGIDREVVRGVSLAVGRGESYGLVGESGCGKSTIALGIVRYLPRNGRVTRGTIEVAGRDVSSLNEAELRRYRAETVSMVYQSPGSALNPSLRAGDQLAEVFRVAGASRREARQRALEALAQVQIADPASVMRRYPHQLSGGMLQRVVIAMALATNPALLILDEPTTGLDATVEAEVLDLVSHLREQLGTSVLFISHNLGIIANMCDRVGVLYAGRLVEEGPAREVFRDPRHPYAVGLLRCLPRAGARKDQGRLDTIPGTLPPIGADLPGCVFADRCGLVQPICREQEPDLFEVDATRRSRCHFWPEAHTVPRTTPETGVAATPPAADGPLIEARDVHKTFRQDGLAIRALTDIDLDLRPGETLGLVGESGSGKTTFARVLLGLTKPDPGSVLQLEGQPLAGSLDGRSRDQVRSIQIVFQNPDAALNRRAGVRRIIGRAANRLLGLRGKELDLRVDELAAGVRLSQRHLDAKPNQLSGGLKQRVAIARAFAGEPRMVVCDEPTSALDVSVQAAILNLLADLQADRTTSYLFISHDLGVVRYLSDRIAVLYLGHVLELGDAERVFSGPHHPYTEALLSAVPSLDEVDDRKRIRLAGEIPSAAHLPTGCVFHSRCPRKKSALCETDQPPLEEKEPGHWMRCHWTLDELRELQQTAPEGQPALPKV